MDFGLEQEEVISGADMAEKASDVKVCALCGVEIPDGGFCVAEDWTPEEVEANNMRPAVLARADRNAEGHYVFYFCQWRHLGLFQSECSPEPAVLKEKEG